LIKNKEKRKPIGLLDSGLGGLSVYREVKKQLPQEQVIYFGDTAHAPYGEKTDEQILNYVFSIIDFLLQQDVKMMIIACNTMTAVALNEVNMRYSIPVIGVIQSGALDAVYKTKNKKIGIIGTEVTIRNQSYEKLIKEIEPSIMTFANPCSNQIIREMEEQALRNEKTIKTLLKECLKPIIKNNIDTLILGCTHYPFLETYIEPEIDPNMVLIDPSEATGRQVKDWLEEHQLVNAQRNKSDSFFISGDPGLFAEISKKLLGYSPGSFRRAII
jgi:glutamate racemase